jgi:hypothetical protein
MTKYVMIPERQAEVARIAIKMAIGPHEDIEFDESAIPVTQEPVAHIQHSRDGVWLHLDFGVGYKVSINLAAERFYHKFAVAYAATVPADATLRPLYLAPPPSEREAKLREALERLARLGNGDRYGNSEGNEIARAALKETE